MISIICSPRPGLKTLDQSLAAVADRINGKGVAAPEVSEDVLALARQMREDFTARGVPFTDGALIAMAENELRHRKFAEAAAATFAQTAAIPRRYADATLKGFHALDEVQASAFRHVCRWANGIRAGRAPWLLLSGSWGTGKTLMVCAALNSLRDAKGLTVRFVACVDLITAIKGTYHDGAETSEDRIVSELARVDVLALDDVGAEPSPFEAKILTRVLDARYRNDLPTAIVTNLGTQPAADGSPSAFETYVGHLIASRVCECADSVDCTTVDFRRMKRGAAM